MALPIAMEFTPMERAALTFPGSHIPSSIFQYSQFQYIELARPFQLFKTRKLISETTQNTRNHKAIIRKDHSQITAGNKKLYLKTYL